MRADLADFLDEYHRALDAFFRGNPAPAKDLYSHRDDVTLANPFGPVASGWAEVEPMMERAASHYREGSATGFETITTYVTPELAYVVEVERFEAKVDGGEEIARGALRVTSILRPEGQKWRVVHRHADPITTSRPATSVVQKRPPSGAGYDPLDAKIDSRGGMPRAQVYVVLGTLGALGGLFYVLGRQWPAGIPMLAMGLFFVFLGGTRMLQLTGRLRDPAPWERRPW